MNPPAGSSSLPPEMRPDSSQPEARGTQTRPSACLSTGQSSSHKKKPMTSGVVENVFFLQLRVSLAY